MTTFTKGDKILVAKGYMKGFYGTFHEAYEDGLCVLFHEDAEIWIPYEDCILREELADVLYT